MINFSNRQDFTPSYTPVEMFSLGIFGGTYFQIPTQLPQEFIQELGNLLPQNTGGEQDSKRNHYGILCGSSLEWWRKKGLIHPDDPNGWVEWYVKFFYGRRHPDDSRQIQRFKSFVARHVGMLRSYEKKGKGSLKTNQNLLQWAWDYKIDQDW